MGGNNANTGNNANQGISLGRGTRSRRAGIDYADEGIYIGNTGNQGNWGNNDNIGNNANEGISLGRGKSVSGGKSVSADNTVTAQVSGADYGQPIIMGNKGNIGKFNRGRGRAGADYQIIMDNDGNTMNTGNTGNNGTTNNNSPAGGDSEEIMKLLEEIMADIDVIKENTAKKGTSMSVSNRKMTKEAGADYEDEQFIMGNTGNTGNDGNTGNTGKTTNNGSAGGDNEDIIEKLKEILEDLETIKDNTDDDDDDDDDTVTAQVSRSGADYTGNSGISFGNGRIRRNRNNVIVKQPGSDYLSFRV